MESIRLNQCSSPLPHAIHEGKVPLRLSSACPQFNPQYTRKIEAFSMLDNDDERDTLLKAATKETGVPPGQIDDIYPCTPVQKSLMALSIQKPGTYVARYVYRIVDGVDLDKFCDSWRTVFQAHTILRTRIIDHRSLGMVQVVLNQGMQLETADSLQQYLAGDVEKRMNFGTKLIRVAISQTSGVASNAWFVITIHHALYDDWGLRVVLNDLEQSYLGHAVQPQCFNRFVEYCLGANTYKSANFWRSELANANATTPWTLPSANYRPSATKSAERWLKLANQPGSSLTSAIVKAGWSILLSQYTESTDVVFGATSTGRDGDMPGLRAMSGVTIATTPFRTRVSPDLITRELVGKVYAQEIRQLPHEQLGLNVISHLDEDAAAACQFNSLLVIQPDAPVKMQTFSDVTIDYDLQNHLTFGTYALTLVCNLAPDGVRVQAVYDECVIKPSQMSLILDQFAHILWMITTAPDSLVEDLIAPSPENIATLRSWNGKAPSSAGVCVHKLIGDQCRVRPEAPAVCTQEGVLPYGELDKLSSRLAARLTHMGVGPEKFIPLCFNKSKWNTIAMLAVMKTGAAFVLLDPSYPAARLQEICRAVEATVILCSASNTALAEPLARLVVPVDADESIYSDDHDQAEHAQPKVGPHNALYAVFTSGSTGKPKGIVIEHNSFCTTAQAYIKAGGLNSQMRALQFASYGFDVSISDTLVTLMAGGCICVPSEEERKNDLAGSIRRMGVNFADLTPSMLQTLSPEDVPSLQTLVLGGEAMSKATIAKWGGHVRLFNAYGPAECCMLSTIQPHVSLSDPFNIGLATGGVCWVVDKTDHGKLMPIGMIGELVMEGPVVGRGYMDEPERSAASFITEIPWLKTFRDNARGPFYKTGDLVRYNADGSLVFVGRKDTQVKIRGQRVELGEIEHHIQQNLPDGADSSVVAEIITPNDGDRPRLVVFIDIGEAAQEPLPRVKETLEACTMGLDESLADILPIYMVPSDYIPIDSIPFTATGKTNRKRLREIGSQWTLERLAMLKTSRRKRRSPATDMERPLQRLWADVLKVEIDCIGADDSFFRLGGDSILAMQVAFLARSEDIDLTVPDIFDHRQLTKLAAVVSSRQKVAKTSDRRSAMSPSQEHFASVDCTDLGLIIPKDSVEQVLPTTGTQRWLLTHWNLSRFTFKIHGQLSVERMQAACESVVQRHSSLRTVFTRYGGTLIQVILRVVDEVFIHQPGDGTADPDVEPSAISGRPPVRFTLTSKSPEEHILVVRLSHAQYDGFSISMLFSDLCAAYNDRTPSALSPTPFSQYLYKCEELKTEKAFDFWRHYLQGSAMTAMPYSAPAEGNRPEGIKEIVTAKLPHRPSDITYATLVNAAFSLVLAQLCQHDDIVFGLTMNTRDVPIRGVNSILGPCINFNAIRVQLRRDWTVHDLCQSLQEQYSQVSRYACLDLSDIVARSTDWPADAKIVYLINHIGGDPNPSLPLDGFHVDSLPVSAHLDLPDEVVIRSIIHGDNFEVHCMTASKLMNRERAAGLAASVWDTVLLFSSSPHTRLSSLLG